MECTIVIQGPAHELLLRSVPEYIKKFPVIISTWKPKNIEEFNLLNKVAEFTPIICQEEYTPEWFNRGNIYKQTVTTLGGLYEVKTKLALKVRSDSYYSLIENAVNKITTDKLLSSRIFENTQYSFHISDYILGGTTESLIKTFEFVEVLCRYTPKNEDARLPDPRWFGLDFLCPTESIICSAYLRQKHIFPDKNNSNNILSDNIQYIELNELGKYVYNSNDLRQSFSN